MDKYKFRKYRKEYLSLFLVEKRELEKILPKNVLIEHVGSTAVSGLGGKGLIDIAIALPKRKIKFYREKLESKGFIYKKKPKDNQRKFMEKRIKSGRKEEIVNVHLTYKTSPIWSEFILFRDYLRKDKNAREEYAKIKEQAIKHNLRGEDYRKFKAKFIRKLIKNGKP